MPPTIDDIRRKLRQENPITAGFDGEDYARKWMKSVGWNYIDVDQSKDNISEALKASGGKRPDFLVEAEENIFVALDAKHKKIGSPPSFCMKTDEIEKYLNLRDFIEKNFGCKLEVLFMLIPKESNGKKIIFIDLDEFGGGVINDINGDPAICLDLTNRVDDQELSFNIP